jgi:integrase
MQLPRNIVQRGKTYYLRLMLGGKVIQKSLGTSDLGEAVRVAEKMKTKLKAQSRPALKQRRAEAARPIPKAAGPTFSSFSQRWLNEFIKQRRNEQNHLIAKQRLRDHTNPFLGSTPLDQVKYGQLRAFRGSLDQSDLSSTTVSYVMGDVRCLLRYALDVEAIQVNPWKASLMPKLPERAPKRLSDEEVEAILLTTPEKYLLAVKLSLLTGVRWGELRNLQWRNVKDLPSPHLILEHTKSGKVRRVPLSSEAHQLLVQEKKVNDTAFVLRWRPAFPGSVVQGLKENSGVQFHWHQFRHTAACRWLDAGGSMESLQRILGHSTITLTEKVYGRLSDRAIFAEADRLNLVTGGYTPDCNQKEA